MSHGPWSRCRVTLDPDSLDCADVAQAPIAMGVKMSTSAKLIGVFVSILSGSSSESRDIFYKPGPINFSSERHKKPGQRDHLTKRQLRFANRTPFVRGADCVLVLNH